MGMYGKGFTNARKEKGFKKLYKKLTDLYDNNDKEYRVCEVDIDENKDKDDGCYGSDANGKLPGCGEGTDCQGTVTCRNWHAGTSSYLKKGLPMGCN